MTKKERIELLETEVAQLKNHIRNLEARINNLNRPYNPPATPFTPPYNPNVVGPWLGDRVTWTSCDPNHNMPVSTSGKIDCNDAYVYTTTATKEKYKNLNKYLNKHF